MRVTNTTRGKLLADRAQASLKGAARRARGQVGGERPGALGGQLAVHGQ